MPTTATLTPNLRKAAVLMRSLDAESAAVLLAQLTGEEAAAVREAMREIGSIAPQEREELRTALESTQRVAPPPVDDDLGVELDFSATLDAIEAAAPPPPDHFASPVLSDASPASQRPFAWLDGGDLPSLAAMLEREHLSTVAVVLSHLPPKSASEVLAALPPGRRAAALERLADLGESDRASLEVIERELADWIATQKAERQRRADRLQAIQDILSHSSAATCSSVLTEIAQHDQALASEIGAIAATTKQVKPPLPLRPVGRQAAGLKPASLDALPAASQPAPQIAKHPTPAPAAPPARQQMPEPRTAFEDIHRLSRDQLAQLFGRCDSQQVVLALAGASQPLIDHIERLLPKNVVKELRRRMHSLSSVRLSDFAAAQKGVARIACDLFGELRP